MTTKGKENESAISPVVGVMLMLVVTIIIAAVVSAFAGSSISGQNKVPQATIQGKFSISTGMTISNAGGDPLATNDLVFTVRNSNLFGSNLEQKTAQVINKTLITNSSNTSILDSTTGSINVPAYVTGDTWYISKDNIACSTLQPAVANLSSDYCFNNTANIGKTFVLEVSDSKGDLISKTDVTISS
jgi:archaeal type IV pilus assembly protein PilA